MKLIPFASVVVFSFAPALALAVDVPTQHKQRHEPQRAMPHPPRSPLHFTLAKGKERQSLEVKYIDAKTIAFSIEKSGTCRRHERGRATIAGKWWLGAETDENEAGEAIAVQEYVYSQSCKCIINFRIDEGGWTQATIRESATCNPACHLLTESMPLRKQ